MKKIIGILGVAVLAMTLYLNTNTSAEDINLESLLSTNIAYAQEGPGGGTATVPCVDVATSGGSLYNNRKCNGCTWDWFNKDNNGTCTYNY